MVKYTNWWCNQGNFVNTQDKWFTNFFDRACQDWNLSSDLIHMMSVFGNFQPMVNALGTKQPRECCILFVGENLQYLHTHYKNEYLMKHFDLLLGFTNFFCQSQFFYFPLYLIYWEFWRCGLFEAKWKETRMDRAVIIANHTADGLRPAMCRTVHRQGILVDGSKPELFERLHAIVHAGKSCQDKIECISNYKYNICPENSVTEGYTTEKVFESLQAGCIPIYTGAKFELNVLRDEFVCWIQPDSKREMIEQTKQPVDKNFWTADALIVIYLQLAKMWVRVWKHIKTDETKLITKPEIVVNVMNKKEAYVELQKHWMKHEHLFEPRIHFEVDGQETSWEEIIDSITK